MNNRCIAPTTDVCEGLISTAGRAVSEDLRGHTRSTHFAQEVFHAVNRKFWDLAEVGMIVSSHDP